MRPQGVREGRSLWPSTRTRCCTTASVTIDGALRRSPAGMRTRRSGLVSAGRSPSWSRQAPGAVSPRPPLRPCRQLAERTSASGTDWALGIEARSRALLERRRGCRCRSTARRSSGSARTRIALRTWPAPTWSTANGCAATSAGSTRASTCGPPTTCSAGSAPRRSPGLFQDRSQFYKEFAIQFYGANRPGAKVSQGVLDQFWLWSMQSGLKNSYDSIKVFSETDFTEDLKSSMCPLWSCTVRTTRSYRSKILRNIGQAHQRGKGNLPRFAARSHCYTRGSSQQRPAGLSQELATIGTRGAPHVPASPARTGRDRDARAVPLGQAPSDRGRQRPPRPGCLLPCHPVSSAPPGRGGLFPLHVLLQFPRRKRPSPCPERALTCGAPALEKQRNVEWRDLEFLQVTSLITGDIFMRETPGGTRAKHQSRPVDLPEHRY